MKAHQFFKKQSLVPYKSLREGYVSNRRYSLSFIIYFGHLENGYWSLEIQAKAIIWILLYQETWKCGPNWEKFPRKVEWEICSKNTKFMKWLDSYTFKGKVRVTAWDLQSDYWQLFFIWIALLLVKFTIHISKPFSITRRSTWS